MKKLMLMAVMLVSLISTQAQDWDEITKSYQYVTVQNNKREVISSYQVFSEITFNYQGRPFVHIKTYFDKGLEENTYYVKTKWEDNITDEGFKYKTAEIIEVKTDIDFLSSIGDKFKYFLLIGTDENDKLYTIIFTKNKWRETTDNTLY